MGQQAQQTFIDFARQAYKHQRDSNAELQRQLLAKRLELIIGRLSWLDRIHWGTMPAKDGGITVVAQLDGAAFVLPVCIPMTERGFSPDAEGVCLVQGRSIEELTYSRPVTDIAQIGYLLSSNYWRVGLIFDDLYPVFAAEEK